MVTRCSYCKSENIALNKNDEWICTECGTVLAPLEVWPRRRLTKKEKLLARLYLYA